MTYTTKASVCVIIVMIGLVDMFKRWIAITIFLVASGCFLYLYVGKRINTVASMSLSCAVAPLLYMQHALFRPAQSYIALSDRVALQSRVEGLEQENHRLIEELVSLRGALQFVDDTAELVQYSHRYMQDERHLVHIILRVLDQCGHYFLVDKGSCHGIEKDMVAVYKNALIGRVDTVYPYWSKILLTSDKRCSVAAFCSKTQAQGICEGDMKTGYITLNHVSHLDTLQKDDYVISSGQGTLFPRGFGIGRVKKYEKDGLFYTVEVKPLISFDSIDYCYLFKKGTECI